MTRLSASVAIAGALVLSACSPGAGHGGLGEFRRSQNSTPHGYTVIADPTGAAPTATIERFEVHPGECGVGALKSEYAGATVTARELYLKYGVYRAFVSRYVAATGADDVPAQTAYFTGVTTAPTMEELFAAR
ncbi:MAG: hypothetical protein ABJ215_03335 [Alphaproteobacteria bacterium]